MIPLILISIAYPFFVSILNLVTGSIPFWYDPARDLLLAHQNIQKLTLIGQPTGIPGIFYGPYWIWLLSLAQTFTLDPRVISFFVLTLPYFLIGSYIFFIQLKKMFGFWTSMLLWWIFILADIKYTSQLWNPHLAPLILLVIISLVIKIETESTFRRKLIYSLALGLFAGFLVSFHFSLGIAVVISTGIFIFITNFKRLLFLPYTTGVLLTFIPQAIFEYRHGFNQTKALVYTLTNSLIYHSAVVGQVGLSKDAIMTYFTNTLPSLLQIPNSFSVVIYILVLISIGYYFLKHKITLTRTDKSLAFFLLLTSTIILIIYLSSKNPVWEYHFIGVEIIFLFVIGLVVTKVLPLRILTSIWVTILILKSLSSVLSWKNNNPLTYPSLESKVNIVKSIYGDAKDNKFSAYAYSGAIYTYDYDYLFFWLSKKMKKPFPTANEKIAYLIIPPTTNDIFEDFIHYKTPDTKYFTSYERTFPDGTVVVKRRMR